MSSPPDRARSEAFRRQAQALEGAGERAAALDAYQAALALRMELATVSLAFWERLGTLDPGRLDAVDGRAAALAALGRAGDAVEALKAAILAHPHEARLWNRLGLVIDHSGDSERALVFFEEAVRLAPELASALYNRGNVFFDLGELTRAEADFDAASLHAASPADSARIALARALLALHRGELAYGWDAYAARNHPDHPAAPVFDAPGERWTPQTELAGAHLLLIGEQGVGDEAMFAGLVGDALDAVGPQGRVSLAVEPRLVALMGRSFPAAQVFAYAAAREAGRVVRRVGAAQAQGVACWAPLADLCQRFRRAPEAFPRAPYLRPDPARVAQWRAWLGEGAPAVGLSWRSGRLTGGRGRQYPSLADWAPVLAVDGVRFVDLQYDGSGEERAELARIGGRPLRVPPGIDLRADLDDLAALACALDRLVSVPNATAAIAAACGARVDLLTAPGGWPRLGGKDYPWYARAHCFVADGYGGWRNAMTAAAAGLARA
jgi:tetratricopeptide (TPR) repeat protein